MLQRWGKAQALRVYIYICNMYVICVYVYIYICNMYVIRMYIICM